MREFLKKLFSRRPPQQLGLEVGPHSASARVRDNDYSWLDPPISLVNPDAWDMLWYEHLSHGFGDFVHLFCDDGALVDTMRANGLNTVLCVGNFSRTTCTGLGGVRCDRTGSVTLRNKGG
jgi:hypothetical protein